MSTWILILALNGFGSGKAIDHINFDTNSDCQIASKKFEDSMQWGSGAIAICVENKHE